QESANGFSRINLQLQKGTHPRVLPIDDFVGYVVYYHLEETEEHSFWLGTEYLYSNSISSYPRAFGSPVRDWIGYQSVNGAEEPVEGIQRLVMFRRDLEDYGINPSDTDTDGNDYKSFRRITFRMGTQALAGTTELEADKVRIKGVKLLV